MFASNEFLRGDTSAGKSRRGLGLMRRRRPLMIRTDAARLIDRGNATQRDLASLCCDSILATYPRSSPWALVQILAVLLREMLYTLLHMAQSLCGGSLEA